MQSDLTRDISFGDCDPAGIVFYPNVFRWMDAAFHDLLRPHGGHAALCARLGATGLGLVDASAQFHSPMRDGDRLTLRVAVAAWSRRTLTLGYAGAVAGVATFTGREVRCLFTPTKTGIVAGAISPLRDLLDPEENA